MTHMTHRDLNDEIVAYQSFLISNMYGSFLNSTGAFSHFEVATTFESYVAAEKHIIDNLPVGQYQIQKIYCKVK